MNKGWIRQGREMDGSRWVYSARTDSPVEWVQIDGREFTGKET